MSTVLTSRLVKTRKEHRCFGCDRKFSAGTMMQRDAVVDDRMFTCHLCETCIKVVNEQFDGEEFYEGQLRDRALELEADLAAADAGKGENG